MNVILLQEHQRLLHCAPPIRGRKAACAGKEGRQRFRSPEFCAHGSMGFPQVASRFRQTACGIRSLRCSGGFRTGARNGLCHDRNYVRNVLTTAARRKSPLRKNDFDGRFILRSRT